MSSPPPALFSLIPINERAKSVVTDPLNSHLLSTSNNGLPCIDIGSFPSKSGQTTLATLGRGDTDVFVQGSAISKIQCSFELELSGQVVMLYDRSHGCTTQVFGDNATPFEHGRLRKVAVNKGLNTRIGIGGEKRNLVVFDIAWHFDVLGGETSSIQRRLAAGFQDHPRLARTVDEADTTLPSQRQTRVHTPGQLMLRSRILQELGRGQFGEVYKALDVDGGRFLAVKIIQGTLQQPCQVKREVEILARTSHPHIVEYITSQGWGGPRIEIYMGLEDKTLEWLVKSGPECRKRGDLVLNQMLMALDFLAACDIIHRDVKPANILYREEGGHYCFRLGDFGLSNRTDIAATFAGSLLFMAPEMFERERDEKQTPKVDIWSLYVTVLWTMDVNGFREASKGLKSTRTIKEAILDASRAKGMEQIRDMAIVDPNSRASAAQMLLMIYEGKGLTTPLKRIPQLRSVSPIPELTVGSPATHAFRPGANIPSRPLARPPLRQARRRQEMATRIPPVVLQPRQLRITRQRRPTAASGIATSRGYKDHQMAGAVEVKAKTTTNSRRPPSLYPGSFPDDVEP